MDMKREEDPEIIEARRRRLIRWSLAIGGGAIILYGLYRIRGILSPFILAMLITYIFSPIVPFLEGRRFPRILAILCTYIIMLVVMGTFIAIIPYIIVQLSELIRTFPPLRNFLESLSDYPKQLQDLLKALQDIYMEAEDRFSLSEGLGEVINQVINTGRVVLLALTQGGVSIIRGMISLLATFIFGLILSFYMIKDIAQIKEDLLKLIPDKYEKDLLEFLGRVNEIFGGFIRGQLLVSFMVGSLVALGLSILGIKFSLIIGILTMILNIVPYLGPVISIIPALLIASLMTPFSIWNLVWIVLIFIGANQVESWFLFPLILGKQVSLHPLIIIFAILAGGSLLGIFGVLIAVPTAAILKVLFEYWRRSVMELSGEEPEEAIDN